MATPTLTAAQIADEVDSFIQENGLFYDFKEYIEKKGFKLSEFGIDEE